ncbi:MAG: hypothetical protein H6818_02310 [Phycisphaerales bacterium]|nr:hypothetical protein [Phycisphaerales bacterium]MCB9863147.1 hypothetical protein [Phycisphaerales bacterium]
MNAQRILPSFTLLAALVALTTAGCGTLSSITRLLSPDLTYVSFVNNGDYAVEGRIIIDDEQNTTEELLEEFGTEISFRVEAGDSMTISRDCDDLQAILLDDANLQVIGSAGPDARSDVFRDGSDFNCGDRITFTFDHGPQIVDFDVSVSIE